MKRRRMQYQPNDRPPTSHRRLGIGLPLILAVTVLTVAGCGSKKGVPVAHYVVEQVAPKA